MGGYGSGRQSTRTTVESALTLDINLLIQQRNMMPERYISGSLTWSNTKTGDAIASIRYEASLRTSEAVWIRLHYNVNGMPKNYLVWLEATSCHYGGFRWWWICPVSGQRAAKLYLPPGATIFAARKAYRLAYQSQRAAAIDRTHARQRRLYRKLGGTYDYFEQLPPSRPKGMHHKTYEQLKTKLHAAMETHEEVFAIRASAVIARLEKTEGQQR